MTALRASCALVVLAVLVVAAAPAAGDGPARLDRVEQHVREGLDANNVPGAALGVVTADGTVHVRGFGTTGRDAEPVTPETPFVIGSVTKSFTALAVMQLVEDGVIELDAPVRRYLPWFEVAPAARTDLVTVRRLLDQTSGLPALAGGPALRWMQDRPIPDTARQLVGSSLTATPGSTWEYANGNYVLLGALIEAVTGRSFGDHLRARILEPLGMHRTFTDLSEAQAAGLADGHRYWFGRPVAHLSYPEGLLPSGLLVSTASDMTRYLRMVRDGGELDGRRIISQAGMEELVRPNASADLGPWAKRRAARYGMGWFVGVPFGPEPAVFHPGATPDFGALAAVLPQRGVAMVLMANVGPRTAGAGGAVDRIGAGAVSLLIDSEPATGRTLTGYYRAFTAVVVTAFLLGLAGLGASLRRPVPDVGRGLGRALRWAGAVLPLALSAAVLAAPSVLWLGWRQLVLWAPDHAVVLAAFASLLLALGAALVTRLLRRSRGGPEGSREPRPPVAVAASRTR